MFATVGIIWFLQRRRISPGGNVCQCWRRRVMPSRPVRLQSVPFVPSQKTMARMIVSRFRITYHMVVDPIPTADQPTTKLRRSVTTGTQRSFGGRRITRHRDSDTTNATDVTDEESELLAPWANLSWLRVYIHRSSAEQSRRLTASYNVVRAMFELGRDKPSPNVLTAPRGGSEHHAEKGLGGYAAQMRRCELH
jgi:hypothetical protein